MPIQVLGEAGHEGDQPLACRRTGAERRLAPDQPFLEKSLALADHRPRQAGAIAEAAEERALADARLRRDVVHRHVLHPALREEALARVEDARRVARRVGTRGGKGLDDGQLDRLTRGRHQEAELVSEKGHSPSNCRTGPWSDSMLHSSSVSGLRSDKRVRKAKK